LSRTFSRANTGVGFNVGTVDVMMDDTDEEAVGFFRLPKEK
jgi:hypothetical protein